MKHSPHTELLNQPISDVLERLQERYLEFIDRPVIRGFKQSGGNVTVATERKPFSFLQCLHDSGQTVFGEKYFQESHEKVRLLGPLRAAAMELRYFGRLQSNKIRRIVQLFDVIESISSLQQARKVARAWREIRGARLSSVMVQVNLGREPQKNGAAPEEVRELIEGCLELGLPLAGLMTIPPKNEAPEPHFRALRSLADAYGLPACQMGFSRDYATAIDCGATHIRVGTVVFGDIQSQVFSGTC